MAYLVWRRTSADQWLQFSVTCRSKFTGWDYNGFSVYFEYSKVIDSVRQHSAKAP